MPGSNGRRTRSRDRRSRSRCHTASRSCSVSPRRRVVHSPSPAPRSPPRLPRSPPQLPRSPPPRGRSPSRLSRSPSRELLREQDKIDEVAAIIASERENILAILANHKAELESKLQTKTRKFSCRQIDKQFQVNVEFRELACKTLQALEAGEVQRATGVCKKLLEDIDKHAEDLIIADQSPHGWLAVAKVRSGQELSKSTRKKLAQVEKDLANRKTGGFKRKSETLQ
jgi:hypothetical protein